MQFAMGVLRIGRCTKFLPYPVLSGFMNAVALLILTSQIAPACGLPSSMGLRGVVEHLGDIKPGAIVVTLITMAVMWRGGRLLPKVPPIILAFASGVAAHHLLSVPLGAEAVGPVVGVISAGLPGPIAIIETMQISWNSQVLGLFLTVLPTAVVLAVLCSTESLLSAVMVDSVAGDRCNGNRELTGQGLSNIVAACFGGIASTGAPVRGIASFRAGGRSRWAGILHSLFLLAALLWGAPLLAHIPYSVMAGIMVMIAISMSDNWTLQLVRQAGIRFAADLAIVVIVVATSIAFNLPMAVMVGLFIACVLFVARMSRPIVRRVLDRSACRSLHIRALGVEAMLVREAQRLMLVELEGPLFFGTAERLRDELERLARQSSGVWVIILDFRRVNDIDISGLRILTQTARSLKAQKIRMLLSSIASQTPRGALLQNSGLDAAIPAADWFATREMALELAEDLVLARLQGADENEARLLSLSLAERMSAEELVDLTGHLQRCQHPAGTHVFHRGDVGDGMFLLLKGFVEIVIPDEKGVHPVRLAMFGPGTFFGEMALLDGGTRSADAVAMTDAITLWLSQEQFEEFRLNYPAAASRFLLNLGRELSERLRMTNNRLQAVE
jgi:anti-anti-sigma factor